MRLTSIIACVLLVGCSSTIQSTPMEATLGEGHVEGEGLGEFAYMLPKGIVNVVVFAYSNGVGITVEPAQITKDSSAGQIFASTDLSIFNKETAELKASTPGLLSMALVDSDAQILEIVEESAKSAARISLQNAKATFMAEKVQLGSVRFDPLSPASVEDASLAVCQIVSRGRKAFLSKISATESDPKGCESSGSAPLVALSVTHTDGTPDLGDELQFSSKQQLRTACAVGICARTMTSRIVRVEFKGTLLGSHVVDVPERNVIAVPIEKSILSDRKTTITVSSGILKEYKVEKEAELLTLVQLPAAVIGGFLAGITDQLTAEKSVADKRKELADSQTAAIESGQKLETASLNLHSAVAGGDAASAVYTSRSLTVYPYLLGITDVLDNIKKKQEYEPAPPSDDGGLTSPSGN